MAVNISPVGLSTTALVADQVSLLATYTEKLSSAFCVNSSLQPQVNVTYSYDTPILNDGTVFVPITAVVTIVVPTNRCNARTMLFTEHFTAAVQGQTAVPTSVTIATQGRTGQGSNVRCCMATGYTINDSLTVTLA